MRRDRDLGDQPHLELFDGQNGSPAFGIPGGVVREELADPGGRWIASG